MYALLRPLIFKLDPETAHDWALGAARVAGNLLGAATIPSVQPLTWRGLEFLNPIGLAAGLDKDATAYNGLAHAGFGFIEVGTVTPRAQPGNPKPRMFRLTEHDAVINRMGFNNEGLAPLVKHLEKRRYPGVLGVNLGKNKDTPAEQAHADYTQGLAAVHHLADYVTVNLSSPNTPGLRDLQLGEALTDLLHHFNKARDALAERDGFRLPVMVKLAPDLADDDLVNMGEQLVTAGIDGVIATNTTLKRDAIAGHPHANETGGVSGAPVRERAQQCVETLRSALGEDVFIVGVGGLDSPESVNERLAAGANAVQLYTGLVYQGPGLVKRCLRAL